MAFPKKYNTVIINILLAVVACLVTNFSYLLAVREQERRDYEATQRMQQWQEEIENRPSLTGVLRVSKDGYGYILTPDSLRIPVGYTTFDTLPDEGLATTPAVVPTPYPDSLALIDSLARAAFKSAADSLTTIFPDSIYVPARAIGELSLTNGSILRVVIRGSRHPDGNPVMERLLDLNGDKFNYGSRFDHPSDRAGMMLQLVLYFVFAFILLTVMTAGAARNASMKFYLLRTAYCIAIAVGSWFLMPVEHPGSREFTIVAKAMNMNEGFRIIDIMLMKCLFVVAFALLYGRTYQLIYQREDIMLENERLKNENLRAHYNTLVAQINPHFLFNSLNSLSALVREGKSGDAVKYIDRLSDTFRYTIRHEPSMTATLGEELEFVDAYKYLLEVRYAEKLFIDIDVDEEKLEWMLPTFSIQPLIENVVKHNTISRARPMRISIRTEGDRLVVSNPVIPKLESEKGTGIGLANLSHRWRLLTGRDIEVTEDGAVFSVYLPFIRSAT